MILRGGSIEDATLAVLRPARNWQDIYDPCPLPGTVWVSFVCRHVSRSTHQGILVHFPFTPCMNLRACACVCFLSLSLSLCLLSSPQLMKERVLELNASDERGISVVREKVNHYPAWSIATSPPLPFQQLVLVGDRSLLFCLFHIRSRRLHRRPLARAWMAIRALVSQKE